MKTCTEVELKMLDGRRSIASNDQIVNIHKNHKFSVFSMQSEQRVIKIRLLKSIEFESSRELGKPTTWSLF